MKRYIVLTSLTVCIVLYYLEQVLVVSYFTKTFSKIILFIIVPYIYYKYLKKQSLKQALNLKKNEKKNFKYGLILGIVAFSSVLIGYYIFKDLIDLNSIKNQLEVNSKVNKANFIFIGLYITFGNSFLEEFFFRGFIFLNLYEKGYKKLAYIFSSLLFGFYHIVIFKTWFNPGLILLSLLGLIIIGFIFDKIDLYSKNFTNSYLVHILADSAIILIGFKMFNII
ncbi:MAG: CPBP family intramembrane glutamic endopeptidase [Clostridiaceae bacterium]